MVSFILFNVMALTMAYIYDMFFCLPSEEQIRKFLW